LSIAGREVDKNPADWISLLKLVKLIIESLLFGLKYLDLLSLQVVLLELSLDGAQPIVYINLTMSLLLDLALLCLRVLVGVLDAQLRHEYGHVELVANFLTIEQKLLHFETTLAEILHQVELLLFILTHSHIAELVLFITIFLFLFLLGRHFNSIRVLSGEVNGLLDESLHDEDVQVEPLADHIGLLLLAGERVTNQAQFDCKPVGCLGMVQASTLFEIDLNDLLEGISEQIVVLSFVSHFKLCLIKVDFSLGTLSRCLALSLRVHLCRWVKNLFKLGLILGDDIGSPLALILKIID